jgi:hypothetical protein
MCSSVNPQRTGTTNTPEGYRAIANAWGRNTAMGRVWYSAGKDAERKLGISQSESIMDASDTSDQTPPPPLKQATGTGNTGLSITRTGSGTRASTRTRAKARQLRTKRFTTR